MPKKRYTAEEIIHKLREAEVWLSQGKSIDRPALTGPGLGLVYAASWFMVNFSPSGRTARWVIGRLHLKSSYLERNYP